MKFFSLFILITLTSEMLLVESVVPSFYDFFVASAPRTLDTVRELFFPPENNNNSIQYFLFTPKNPENPYFIEPTPEIFDQSPFDPNLDTKIIIHGFYLAVSTFDPFVQIKDALLTNSSYNVIYVNWHRYNNHPYITARLITVLIGKKVAEFINFMQTHTGVSSDSIHVIGHSLGTNIAGIVGKNVNKLGRITGLDTSAPLYGLASKDEQLTHDDAKFVDIIHSSAFESGQGVGKFEPSGHLDFYPNGGRTQPSCYPPEDSAEVIVPIIQPLYDIIICNHLKSIEFFLYSILDCEYQSTNCDDYENLSQCESNGNSTARMGFFAEPINGLPVHSKFYLTTSYTKPYCDV